MHQIFAGRHLELRQPAALNVHGSFLCRPAWSMSLIGGEAVVSRAGRYPAPQKSKTNAPDSNRKGSCQEGGPSPPPSGAGFLTSKITMLHSVSIHPPVLVGGGSTSPRLRVRKRCPLRPLRWSAPPHLRRPPRTSISLAPTFTRVSMRPETERNIDEIQQAIALLRRHL